MWLLDAWGMLTSHSPSALPRSTSDIGSKTRMGESTGPEPAQLHDSASFAQVSRGPVSVTQLDQSALNYSGEPEEENSFPCAESSQIHTNRHCQEPAPPYVWVLWLH